MECDIFYHIYLEKKPVETFWKVKWTNALSVTSQSDFLLPVEQVGNSGRRRIGARGGT